MRLILLIVIVAIAGLSACKKDTPFQYSFSFQIGTRQYAVDSVYGMRLDTAAFALSNNNRHSPVYMGLTASAHSKTDNFEGLYSAPSTGNTFGTVQGGNFLVIVDSTDKNNGNYLPGSDFYLRITQDDGHTMSGTFSGGLVFSGSAYGNTGQSSNRITNGQFSVTYK